MDLKPVSAIEFNNKFIRKDPLLKAGFEQYFTKTIEEVKSYAFGPYFWLIPDQSTMTLIAASPNIGQLTPYKQDEWLNKDAFFWFENMHPDDREFVTSGLAISMDIQHKLPIDKAENVRINIYLRMLDTKNVFRWVLMQFPKRLYNEDGKILSTLILTTDLSHLKVNFTRMMTMIDATNDETILFATKIDNDKMAPFDIPSISKREYQIVQLMVKGLNSPQIAEKLFISYSTVEKHKQNLRQKTNTKTSAELIDFVWRNNLI
jgi:DNA-binding CsgD family transcriptional regulator